MINESVQAVMEEMKPLRNRVEVVVTDGKGKVYGGYFDDGCFGFFGGGVDDDKLAEAASREFEEETGHKVTGLKKMAVKPVTAIWDHKPTDAKGKARMAKFRGTKTWWFTGTFEEGDGKKANGDDGKSPLKKVGWHSIKDAIKGIRDNMQEAEGPRAQAHARIKALESLQPT